LGVLYYIIYNPEYNQRDRQLPLAIYKLMDGTYQLQLGEPYWMPEVGLGIGRCQQTLGGIPQEVLTWYDGEGNRYLPADELVEQIQSQLSIVSQRELAERQRAQAERQRADQLAEYLRSIGIDPNHLPPH
jgi:hypothetical protein